MFETNGYYRSDADVSQQCEITSGATALGRTSGDPALLF